MICVNQWSTEGKIKHDLALSLNANNIEVDVGLIFEVEWYIVVVDEGGAGRRRIAISLLSLRAYLVLPCWVKLLTMKFLRRKTLRKHSLRHNGPRHCPLKQKLKFI